MQVIVQCSPGIGSNFLAIFHAFLSGAALFVIYYAHKKSQVTYHTQYHAALFFELHDDVAIDAVTFPCSSSACTLLLLNWNCCCHCTGVVALIAALALLPSFCWHCVPCHASMVLAKASMPLLCWCSPHPHGCNGISHAFLLPSCLPWLVVA